MRITPIHSVYEPKFQTRRISRSFSELVEQVSKKAAVLDKATA